MTYVRPYEILVTSHTPIDDVIWQQMWLALAPRRPIPPVPGPGRGVIVCGAFAREIAETHASVLAHALLSQRYDITVGVRPQAAPSDLSTFG